MEPDRLNFKDTKESGVKAQGNQAVLLHGDNVIPSVSQSQGESKFFSRVTFDTLLNGPVEILNAHEQVTNHGIFHQLLAGLVSS